MPEASLDAIVTALIANSLQAGASQIRFDGRREGSLVTLSVIDDGPGIAAGDQARV